MCPGYVRTNLNANASYFDKENEKTEEKGMDSGEFSLKVVEAIFLKKNEVVIDKQILPRLAVLFRNLLPDVVFKSIAKKTKKK